MREEKFKVINFIRELILKIDGELENFPKKDIELKNRLRTNSYDLLEISYFANNISDITTKKVEIEKAIAKIKVMDFLINLCYDKQIINQRKYIKLAERIDDIVKYLIGWEKSLNN